MGKNKILYVGQQVFPYLPESVMATRLRALAQGVQECGNEIRTFMPRWGVVNERRNQLHEVIRLSGMNLIIDDNDHQLIIKVASIPTARVQIYFIDNDDYFHRKAVLTDDNGVEFEDNDERAIFFARGVLETVKKLRWEPDVMHLHGWFSSIVPLYLRGSFADDPVFKGSKVVVSLYNDRFEGTLNTQVRQKLASEGMMVDGMELLDDPTYENLMKLVIDLADGVVVEEPLENNTLVDYARKNGKEILDQSAGANPTEYDKFYDLIIRQ